MNKEEKTIYNMELHEEISINSELTVLRVSGGWTYSRYVSGQNEWGVSSTFIPYSTEFLSDKE